MTLTEIRNKVSQDLGYDDWKELRTDLTRITTDLPGMSPHWFDLIVTNVAKLNAEEKVKEALQLGAKNLIQASGTWNSDYKSQKLGILSLSEELINKIKKEI